MDGLRIGNISQASINGTEKTRQKSSTGFGEVIKEALGKVNTLESEADRSIIDLLQGKADIHETMIALQKSDISMRLLLAIRGKVIEAYREIMHMQF
ncbi:MAG: flagellar hook-basal body complex protein FliE [Deltaproteobacteria bacterium]|nr:flagellar hook-basal body complex protein FliE [Deltaproteobacteria bacterium]MBW2340090.1 flagellar hook-basal body complex protein FliE [Deltaproteobacteria bacterium]